MGVEDKIAPLDLTPFKKKQCGGTASTASNSNCMPSSKTSRSYGPLTVTSRIPVPPRTSTCSNSENIPTQNVICLERILVMLREIILV